MATLKAMRENLAGLVAKGREVVEAAEKENRGLSAADKETLAKVENDSKSLIADIQAIDNLRRIEDQSRQSFESTEVPPLRKSDPTPTTPAITDRDHHLAVSAWMLAQAELGDAIKPEHVEAAKKLRVPLNAGSTLNLRLPTGLRRPDHKTASNLTSFDSYVNTLGTAPDQSGGYTVPKSLAASLERALLDFSGVLQVATIVTTADGGEINFPMTNDTTNKASLVGENALISTTSVDPSFSSLSLKAFNYQSGFIRISSQLLRDSNFDMPSLLGSMIGERHGRRLNTDCTVGSGASLPTGIVPASTLGNTTASATAVTFDEIITHIHKVDPAYRPGAAFMMHDGVFLQVALLKAGGTNDYLLTPDATAPIGYRARGYPIFINQDMQATLASATKTMLFGQLSKYIIRRAGTLRLVRAAERFVEYDQVAFIGFMSYDGGLLDAGTNPVKHLLQAT